MAEEIPDLVIPVRLENAAALRALNALEQKGEQSAAGVAKGMAGAQGAVAKVGTEGSRTGEKVKEGMDKGREGASGLEQSIAGVLEAQMSLAVVERAGAAIGSEFKRAADYVQTLAKEFSELRTSMGQVAALRGEGNTNEFTLEQTKKATAANLMPEEWRGFQEEFQSYAGAQIEGPEAKLNKEQADDYQQRVAAFMKAHSLPPAMGAQLAGSLLENARGPQNVDDLMAILGKTFAVLDKSRTPIQQLLPQMSQLMSYNVNAEEAAQMLAVVAPASPNEVGVGAESALKAVEEMKIKGTGEEFGVKPGMGKFESVQSFAKNINERRKALISQGKTEEETEDAIGKLLAEKGVAADVRERRGLVRGYAFQGEELGGFKRFKRYAEETPRDFAQRDVEAWEKTDEGSAAKARADAALARAERGAKYQGVELERQKAETELTREGGAERGGIGRALRGAASWVTGQSAEEQLVSERALERIRARAAGAGVSRREIEAQAGQAGHPVQLKGTVDPAFLTKQEVNDEILATLKAIERHQEAATEHLKQSAAHAASAAGATQKAGTRPPAALPATPPKMARGPGG